MKKLSLLLALLLALSVCLVACGGGDDKADDSKEDSGDVSTPADDSADEPADDSSEPADDSADEPADESSEPADDSADEPADDSSEPADDSSEPTDEPAAGPVGSNVAAGKPYTTSKLYAQDETWQYNEAFPPAYPDDNNAELTDGTIAEDTDYMNAAWVGLHDLTPDSVEAGYSWVTVDLGEVKTINYIKLYAGSANTGADQGVGIGAPSSVEFFGSADGVEFTSLGSATVVDGDCYSLAELGVAADVQYVEARIVRGGWIFVCEIEVFAE